jgi:hypothetical protein
VDNEPRISISNVTNVEGRRGKTTLFTFTVTLSAAYDQPVTMSFRTVNGTATTGDNDYDASTGTLTFAPRRDDEAHHPRSQGRQQARNQRDVLPRPVRTQHECAVHQEPRPWHDPQRRWNDRREIR